VFVWPPYASEKEDGVKLQKIIEKAIRHTGDGSTVAGDVNAVVSANVGESGSENRVSSRRRTTVVQRSGQDGVSEPARPEREGGAA
jgi:hypothetical protein